MRLVLGILLLLTVGCATDWESMSPEERAYKMQGRLMMYQALVGGLTPPQRSSVYVYDNTPIIPYGTIRQHVAPYGRCVVTYDPGCSRW